MTASCQVDDDGAASCALMVSPFTDLAERSPSGTLLEQAASFAVFVKSSAWTKRTSADTSPAAYVVVT